LRPIYWNDVMAKAITAPIAAKNAMCVTKVRMYRQADLTLPNKPQVIKKTIPSMQPM